MGCGVADACKAKRARSAFMVHMIALSLQGRSWQDRRFQVLNFPHCLQGADVYVGCKVAMAELIMSGCTTTSDHHYVFPNDVQVSGPSLSPEILLLLSAVAQRCSRCFLPCHCPEFVANLSQDLDSNIFC